MRNSSFLSGALGIATLSSAAFGWSISGTVVDNAGQGIPGAAINSFNYAGIGTQSGVNGEFSLSNETEAMVSIRQEAGVSVQKQGGTLNIANPSGKDVKITLMNVMGKVIHQELTAQNIQLDLKKFGGQKHMILRVEGQGSIENYIVSSKGIARNTLKKEGDPLASLQFSKEGYQTVVYVMTQEDEAGVEIVLQAASAAPSSSSSSQNPWTPISSSSQPDTQISSSSKIIDVVSCLGKTYAAGDHRMSVNVDGKDRTFIMHVPSAYTGDKAVPLVVDYHPIGGSGQGQLSGTTYKNQTDPEGVISLYPDGTSGKSQMGAGWNVGPCCSFDDDVKFSREMIKKVEETVCIDPTRVYATGFSMGGGMSNHVACNMSDVYAAVAPAAMDLNTTNSAQCNTVRAVPIIMFRGTDDFVCKYGGGDSGFNDGLNFLGAEGNFKFWAEKNDCSGTPTTNANGCQEYSNCKDGSKVVLCTKQGGGHEQGDGSVGWPFLKQFSL